MGETEGQELLNKQEEQILSLQQENKTLSNELLELKQSYKELDELNEKNQQELRKRIVKEVAYSKALTHILHNHKFTIEEIDPISEALLASLQG